MIVEAKAFRNLFEAKSGKTQQLLGGVQSEVTAVGQRRNSILMLDAVILNSPPLVGSRDGYLAIEIITAIYKAGFSGQTITLPLNRNDSFYTLEGIRRNVRNFYEKTVSLDYLEEAEITVSGS